MSSVIFVRSYDGDAEWLERTLPVNMGWAIGFDRVVVCGVPGESERVAGIAEACGAEFVYDEQAGEIEDGYINQQFSKLRADIFCGGGVNIVYIDSDCLAAGPFAESDWKLFGKPYGLYSDWGDVGEALMWRAPTAHAIGGKPPYEFMRRLPAMYPGLAVKGAREHIERVHGLSLLEYLKGRKCFSEFNVLGACAYLNAHKAFTWVCPEREDVPVIPFRQFWSHGGTHQIDEQP